MALFCKDCAKKYGQEQDTPPFLCEGCGKNIVKRESILKVVFKKLKSK